MRFTHIALISIVIIMMAIMMPPASADSQAPMIKDMTPEKGAVISNGTPTISAVFYDPDGIDLQKTSVFVDKYDVSEFEGQTVLNESGFAYKVPTILKLKEGNHTVRVEISDKLGNNATYTWNFTYDPNYVKPSLTTADIVSIYNLAFIIIGLALIISGIYLIYLRKYKRFTFKKFFLRKPIKKKVMVVYIPIVGAITMMAVTTYLEFVGVIHQGAHGQYLVFNVALVIALLPIAIESLKERKRKENYERAFAQFLFELADAIRGGIDPAKAIVEFSKVEKGILKQQIKIAADGIMMGRPFEEMLEVMVKPMGSELIKRYASLIGEASKIGGDIAVVIHRAAQDLDELVKIEAERRRQLSVQGTTIYIAFGVLIVIVYQLVNTFSSLGQVSLAGLMGGSSSTEAGTTDITTLKQNFYLVTLSLGISCGLLIGALTDGKIRLGLIHALGMGTASTIIFILLIF